MMNILKMASATAWLTLGVAACSASPQPTASSPQPIVPGTEERPGATNEQALADAAVVERISNARCDRSQSCSHIGHGAVYRDRDDCMSTMRALVGKQLNASRCPGGMGEVGVSRCVKSLHDAECDSPGQVEPTTSHCKVDLMCLR